MNESEKLYLKDLEALNTLSEEEIKVLVSSGLDETETRNALILGVQKRLYDLAGAFASERVPRMDLVMEGNAALLRFLEEKTVEPEDFLREAEKAVKAAMKRFATEEDRQKKAGDLLSEKLNVLNEVTVRFSKVNGRAPTKAELAELLLTDEDEIEYLMNTALAALKAEESENGEEES